MRCTTGGRWDRESLKEQAAGVDCWSSTDAGEAVLDSWSVVTGVLEMDFGGKHDEGLCGRVGSKKQDREEEGVKRRPSADAGNSAVYVYSADT